MIMYVFYGDIGLNCGSRATAEDSRGGSVSMLGPGYMSDLRQPGITAFPKAKSRSQIKGRLNKPLFKAAP